jgi:sigma-B regulation protein RsbU (phosphoserine phosphatase)
MSNPDHLNHLLDLYFGPGIDRRVFSRNELQEVLKRFEVSIRNECDGSENAIYLENLLSHIPERIYFKDTESQFIKVNRYFAESHGFKDPEELYGKTDFDLFPYKIAIARFADEQRVIQKNEVIVGKDDLDEYADGSFRWMSTTKLPLYDREGKIVGTFGISRDITERKVAEDKQQRFADQLKQKNEQIETDLEMARKVQLAFLPKSYPSFIWDLSSNESALKFFHRYEPSEELAGDFFQVIPISNSQAGIIVCDVMGHGVRASLVTAVLRGLVGEMKLITPYPHVFLRKVNQRLHAVFKQLDMTMFVTAFYAVFDLIKGQLRYANAGHPLPVIFNRALPSDPDFLEPVSEDPEPALGLIDNFKYSFAARPIEAGDSVLFYTDGILELENKAGEQFGELRMVRSFIPDETTLNSSDPMLDRLFESIREFTGGGGGQDDICAVTVDVLRTADKRI